MEFKPGWASGIPHRVTKGDMYKGYFIPAGSIVIGNAWYAPLLSIFGGINLNLNFFCYSQGDNARPRGIPRTQSVPPRALARTWRACLPRCCIRFRAARVPGALHGPRKRMGCHCGRVGDVRDFAGGGRSAEGAVRVWNRCVRYFVMEFCSAGFMRRAFSSYPEPFKCLVRPRSEAFAALVRATANES